MALLKWNAGSKPLATLPRIPPSPMLAVNSHDVEGQPKIVLVDIE